MNEIAKHTIAGIAGPMTGVAIGILGLYAAVSFDAIQLAGFMS